MNKTGTVLKKETGKSLVLIFRDSACGDNCAGCGVCSREKTVWVKDDTDSRKGDRVEIFLERKSFLLMCFMAYVLPLAVMLSLFALFYTCVPERGIADLCCTLSAVLTIALMIKIKPGKKYKCRVVRKL